MPPAERFPSTRKSLMTAAQGSPGELRQEAIASLVEAYWNPAFHYIQLRWNVARENARDLTQGFFTALLERDLLAAFDPAKASFRTYLRLCIDSHVKNEWTARNRSKRGGGAEQVPFSESLAAPGNGDLEELFHREWQRQMFSLALRDLREQCSDESRRRRYDLFARYDLAEGARPSYAELAREAGVTITQVTNALAWARRELRRCLLDRLAGITAGEREFQQEAEWLFGVLPR
jgi:RNA polymerase sigma factor (sigma-70 family)